MTCADFQDLSVGLALDILYSDERAEARAHLREPHHSGCPEALHRAQSVAGKLAAMLPERRVPARVWQGIETRVAPRKRVPLAWAVAVAAMLVAVLLGFWLVQATHRAPVAELASAAVSEPGARLVPLAAQPGWSGSAVAVISADRRRALLISQTLPSTPGHDYELWVIPSGGKPIPAGLVRQREGALALGRFDPAQLGRAAAVAVSLEPEGGAPNGTPTQVLLVGALGS